MFAGVCIYYINFRKDLITMNKDQLINSVAERTGATRAMSRTIIDAALDSIGSWASVQSEVSVSCT